MRHKGIFTRTQNYKGCSERLVLHLSPKLVITGNKLVTRTELIKLQSSIRITFLSSAQVVPKRVACAQVCSGLVSRLDQIIKLRLRLLMICVNGEPLAPKVMTGNLARLLSLDKIHFQALRNSASAKSNLNKKLIGVLTRVTNACVTVTFTLPQGSLVISPLWLSSMTFLKMDSLLLMLTILVQLHVLLIASRESIHLQTLPNNVSVMTLRNSLVIRIL
jgi:hypothetical protein